jgi:hypothetical protein
MAATPLDTLDEGIIETVDKLLEDTDKIPTKTALSLNLAMTSRSYKAINQLIARVEVTNGQVGTIKADIAELQKKNIINWMGKNPKSFIMVFVAFILFTDVVVEKISSADSWAFIVAVGKKWLGL